MKLRLILLPIVITFSTAAMGSDSPAGADSSGGGKVVACRDAGGELRSVELLDLFEARALYGLQLSEDEASVERHLAAVEKKLNEIFDGAPVASEAIPYIREARANVRLLPSGTSLVDLNDAEEIALPNGCRTEQLAVYRENAVLFVNSDLWSHLDTRNKAALFVHEGVYRLERHLGAINSIYARKVTGHLMSRFEFEPLLKDLPAGAKQCGFAFRDLPHNKTFYNFYLSEGSAAAGGIVLQFLRYGGRLPFGRAVAVINPGDAEGEGAQGLSVESNFEALPGFSVTWKSKTELLAGKFKVVSGSSEADAVCFPRP